VICGKSCSGCADVLCSASVLGFVCRGWPTQEVAYNRSLNTRYLSPSPRSSSPSSYSSPNAPPVPLRDLFSVPAVCCLWVVVDEMANRVYRDYGRAGVDREKNHGGAERKVQGRRKDSLLTRFPRENLLEIGEGLAALEGCLNRLRQTRLVSDTRSRDAL
jgi:hypothetical protein